MTSRYGRTKGDFLALARTFFRDTRSMDATISSFDLACWRGAVPRMSVAHTHDDLEFNCAPVELEYLVDGRQVVIPAGALAVFWAARPHQLVRDSGGSELAWLTVPLAQARGWRLPGEFLTRMFAGDVAVAPEAVGPLALAERAGSWSAELDPTHPLHRAAVTEVQAFVLRAAFATAAEGPVEKVGGGLRADVADMAAWIARHAAEDVTVAAVAAHVHLHPNHAMTVFRHALGVTIGEYLAQCRIARARELLLTTDDAIPDIAASAGFGSLSQFYARFRDHTGEAPAAYRRRHAG
ncbi:helix-turn-helix domain-containing protein [Microbacterium sp. IEGM 1404]|uniref:helix-turn-helix domain-containing protein n=1 Tax=Microbacterium sp. IEGM 1404 TaxID=3047084 RepID=UPI0024B6F654|nr:helix-turn-helix domain-containing protein [Microbacterium sp. IEGM 1404]MDI9890922.1 helix-turn-helix domain-containing protein [Microbacterium sp. IEGM 1404]